MPAHIAHLWLTPFLGTQEADAFIDQQLQDAGGRLALRVEPGGRA